MTKCRPPWLAALKFSRLYCAVLVAGATCSLWAISISPLHPVFHCLLIAGLLVSVASQIAQARRLTSIKHDVEKNIWVITTKAGSPRMGHLVSAGYRCSFLVILVIQSDNNNCHYVPVWQDQISDLEFSYLHYQLLYNTVNRRSKWTEVFSKRA